MNKLKLIPVKISNSQVGLANPDEGKLINDLMLRKCASFNTFKINGEIIVLPLAGNKK